MRERALELALPAEGNIENQPRRGWVNVNYPLSQCLFRRADIQALREELLSLRDISSGDALAHLMLLARTKNIPKRLRSAFDEIEAGDAELRAAYSAVLPAAIATAGTLASAERVAREPSNLWPIRLLIRHAAGKELDILLQVDRGTGPDREWVGLSDVDGASIEFNQRQFLDGISPTPYSDPVTKEERTLYFSNDYDVIPFVKHDFSGLFEYRPKHPHRQFLGDPVRLLGTPTDIGAIVTWYEKLRKERPEITAPIPQQLVKRFHHLACIDAILPLDVERQALPGTLQRFVSTESLPRPKVRGYNIDGQYLPRSPLRLELEWSDEIGRLPKYECDGKELSFQIRDGIAVADLSYLTEAAGIHTIKDSHAATPEIVVSVASDRLPDFGGCQFATYFDVSSLRVALDVTSCKEFEQTDEGDGFSISGASLICAGRMWREP